MTSTIDAADFDLAWLVSDSADCLAAVVTAGAGPLPESVFGGPVDLSVLENRLLRLPVVGAANVLIENGDMTSFLNLAMRGLFVFDWTDVHRSGRAKIDAYQLVAVPSCAIHTFDLPADLDAFALRQRLSSTFRDHLTLDMLAD
ncbi:MAG TPA: hypothetical protein VN137_11985 [Sphingomonas sp.]|nr:hypothetical protein [Sphingomonas sp.]